VLLLTLILLTVSIYVLLFIVPQIVLVDVFPKNSEDKHTGI